MTAMNEKDESELRTWLFETKTGRSRQRAVFLYTPLCGTCAMARKMLEVVLVMRPQLEIAFANVNRMPQLAQEWQIESVPCISVWKDGRLLRKAYAMHSVQYVLDLLSEDG